LSSDDPNASIRYTLVSTAQTFSTATNYPTATSPLYTGPIAINGTVQVRARAFSATPNTFPGPVRTECFIQLSNNMANFTSTIPIVVIHTMGSGFSGGNGAPDTSVSIAFFDNECGYSAVTNKPSLIKRAGMNIRGASTQGYAKSSWAVELWDEFNEDDHLKVLGLPDESDWILYAPNSFDLPQIHNPLYYGLGRLAGPYASRTRFVEVFVRTGNCRRSRARAIRSACPDRRCPFSVLRESRTERIRGGSREGLLSQAHRESRSGDEHAGHDQKTYF
jgi:hypothetical protein